jgi:hypothetical protein
VTDLFNIAANGNIPEKTTGEDRLKIEEIVSVLSETEISRTKSLRIPDTCSLYISMFFQRHVTYIYLGRYFQVTVLKITHKICRCSGPLPPTKLSLCSCMWRPQFRMSESAQTRFMSSVLGDICCNKTNEDSVIDLWLSVSFRKAVFSVCENLPTPCLIPKLEDYHFLAFCIYFIQFILRSPA